jgi:integration host factor subunit beta
LIEKPAVRNKIRNAVAEKIVTGIINRMPGAQFSGNWIEIRDFGSFEVREYDRYTACNPKTCVQIKVRPKKFTFFKTGRDHKERITDSGN